MKRVITIGVIGVLAALTAWVGKLEYDHHLRTESAWLYLVQELGKTEDGRVVRLGDVVADLVNKRVAQLKDEAAAKAAEGAAGGS